MCAPTSSSKRRASATACNSTIDVPPSRLDLLLPAFVLQPLVENSIQHGMRADAPLHVAVTSSFHGDVAMLSVTDDGAGIPEDDLERILEPGFGKGNGIALKNVHERLRGHFGPDSGVSAASVPGSGATVTLVIVRPPEGSEEKLTGETRLAVERRA